MTTPTSLVWLRQDLRLADNPALHAALNRGRPVLVLYILDDKDGDPRGGHSGGHSDNHSGGPPWGGAGRWWLHHSLRSLSHSLAAIGAPLTLRRGVSADIITTLCREYNVGDVYWNRAYEPHAIARDTAIKDNLKKRGLACQTFNGRLLHEPWNVKSKNGDFYRVFTPFWKACLGLPPPDLPLPAPDKIEGVAAAGDTLDDWNLCPKKPDWSQGLRACWSPGEAGATHNLNQFLKSAVQRYRTERNHPDKEATSRLSPHLCFGEISPRTIWHAVQGHRHAHPGAERGLDTFLSEVGWREFSYNLLFHYPTLPSLPLRQEFADFPWKDDRATLRAWQRGMTGYPIVDAGMRELWHTGYMHNRVRMITASFLVKDLMIPWQAGAAWFEDTLCDADLANNSASWQWVAGCGADAAPYFRIFNPTLQGQKFDSGGTYVRRWIPEIAALSTRHIHTPWCAPPQDLEAAGIQLGKTYPKPVIDHAQARAAAMTAYQKLVSSRR